MLITIPPQPNRFDIVRCYLNYPHDKHPAATHPALVLQVFSPGKIEGLPVPIVVVAGGTGVFESATGGGKVRKKIFNGEIPLKEDLCLSAGLKKETKFCFAREGVIAFPWDNDFFRWDPNTPHAHGEPLYGALDRKHRSFRDFKLIFDDSPEGRVIDDTINHAIRCLAQETAQAIRIANESA